MCLFVDKAPVDGEPNHRKRESRPEARPADTVDVEDASPDTHRSVEVTPLPDESRRVRQALLVSGAHHPIDGQVRGGRPARVAVPPLTKRLPVLSGQVASARYGIDGPATPATRERAFARIDRKRNEMRLVLHSDTPAPNAVLVSQSRCSACPAARKDRHKRIARSAVEQRPPGGAAAGRGLAAMKHAEWVGALNRLSPW